MIPITEAFIDQVIYHRVSALALKGSVYTSLHVQDLIVHKQQVVGEGILLEIERAADDAIFLSELKEGREKIRTGIEKIRFLAEMDGMDAEPSEEALEIFFNEIAGVADGQ